MKFKLYILSAILCFGMLSCETDFPNVNSPLVEDLVNSPEGLYGLIIGVQYQYTIGGASGLYTSISASGLTTNELQVLNAGNAQIAALANGGDNVAPNNSVVTNLWTNLNLVRSNGEKLAENAGVIADIPTAAGVEIYGRLFKALAYGTSAQFFNGFILRTGENQPFVSRTEALEAAIAELQIAMQLLEQHGISSVLEQAVGTNIDVENTLRALSARYYLMLGDYDNAFDMASAVDLTVASVFVFDEVSPNPVFRSSLTTNNVYDVNPDFGLSGVLTPDAADERAAFYLDPQEANGKGFFLSDATSIPLYLPGEMTLIRAEVYARNGQLPEAIGELNSILTKTPEEDLYGLGANLPEYNGANTEEAVLEAIYQNRCIELYMSGLKLEDSRRFGRPGPNDANAERNRDFYPFPSIERDNNPNTPPDPEL